MDFRLDITSAMRGMVRTQEKTMRAIELYGKTAALKLEARAKQDAPWHDRTGNARQTIRGAGGFGGVNTQIKLGGTGRIIDGREQMRISSVVDTQQGTASTYVIALSGNMEYSVYLELAHGKRIESKKQSSSGLSVAADGKFGGLWQGYQSSDSAPYAVLWPTVNAMQGEILRGFANMLGSLR